MSYIGRFAPSPTGVLHFGSLVTALASYLDARHQHGRWLVRIEDIDPPREQPGAADTILRQLEAHGLTWDDTVLYQSTRLEAYRDALSQLEHQGLTYACQCSRSDLNAINNIYDRRCLFHPPAQTQKWALRFRLDQSIEWQDQLQGVQRFTPEQMMGDFILLRKEGLFSYQLAVAVDDMAQGITHVIRGADLLDSTPRQISLMEALHSRHPHYAHLPVVLNSQGQKLSKQQGAKPLDSSKPKENIDQALRFLGQSMQPSFDELMLNEQLAYAIEHWDIHRVPLHNRFWTTP